MLFLSGVRVRKGLGGDLNIRHVRFCTGGHGGKERRGGPTHPPPNKHIGPTGTRRPSHPTPPQASKQPAGQNVMVPLHNDSYPLNTYIQQHHAQANTHIHHAQAFLVPDSPILTTDQKPTQKRTNQQPTTTNQPKKAPLTHMKVSLSACRSPHKCRWMVCQNGQKM